MSFSRNSLLAAAFIAAVGCASLRGAVRGQKNPVVLADTECDLLHFSPGSSDNFTRAYKDSVEDFSMDSGGAILVTNEWNMTEPVETKRCAIILPADAPGGPAQAASPKKPGLPSAQCFNAAGQAVFDGNVSRFHLSNGIITVKKDRGSAPQQVAAKVCIVTTR